MSNTRENCIFCKIATKRERKGVQDSKPHAYKFCILHQNSAIFEIFLSFLATEIVYEEDDFIVFKDYRPAAQFHILIVPKKHYGAIQNLKKSDIGENKIRTFLNFLHSFVHCL